jgi:2'-5' RNA ligase
MGKIIAIDVVLVPPKEIIEKALEINAKLSGVISGEYPKMGDDCVPHNTLCMGFVDEEKIDEIKKILSMVAEHTNQIKIDVNKCDQHADSGIWWFIKKSKELETLHNAIAKSLHKYFLNEGDESAYVGENIAQSSIEWPKKFKEKHSFENYNPHITLGFGEYKDLTPFSFEAKELALFHLGPCNTCRKKLGSWKLE